jgi:hypothetical protein
MDEEANLVGVKETVNFEEREVEDAETTQLRNELLVKNIIENDTNKSNEQQDE